MINSIRKRILTPAKEDILLMPKVCLENWKGGDRILKIEDGKLCRWNPRDKSFQATLDKYFSGKLGEALISAKNS